MVLLIVPECLKFQYVSALTAQMTGTGTLAAPRPYIHRDEYIDILAMNCKTAGFTEFFARQAKLCRSSCS